MAGAGNEEGDSILRLTAGKRSKSFITLLGDAKGAVRPRDEREVGDDVDYREVDVAGGVGSRNLISGPSGGR